MRRFLVLVSVVLLGCTENDTAPWWDGRWRFRTTIISSAPCRDNMTRPVEAVIDFEKLLEESGVPGKFDPGSVIVIDRTSDRKGTEIPCAYRTEFDARLDREVGFLTWMAGAVPGACGIYDVYFDTRDRSIDLPAYQAELLPPVNLLKNPGFEDETGGLPTAWAVTPGSLATVSGFSHTTGRRSLKIVVDADTPPEVEREVILSQTVDVQAYRGQEVVFSCDLLAERAIYGAPVCIELEQYRQDGSRIRGYAVQPRWLTLELAQGQPVQLRERGRFSPEAAQVKVRVRLRLYVRDEDTGDRISGPESFFTVWLDNFVVRPGERWAWPALSNAGYVKGIMEDAPLNRGFEFTGQRRLTFNGASEGTLTANSFGDEKSVHWGLQAGTLEFWCCPSWNTDDGKHHVLFDANAIPQRRHSMLHKLGIEGDNHLEFIIYDSDYQEHIVRGPALFSTGQWHHVAATWDFQRASLQLFVDGRLVAREGPGEEPWAFSLTAVNEKSGRGVGVSSEDSRSIPMQGFIGGDRYWDDELAAEAVIDEFRISDIERYKDDFVPVRREFQVDTHTRALFHFENERDGVHDSDDHYVRGYLSCELEPQSQKAVMDRNTWKKIERTAIIIRPHAPVELFEANRASNRMKVTRPFKELPDPRFVEYRRHQIEHIIDGTGNPFIIDVGGDLEPWMCSITFEPATDAGPGKLLLPRWQANDNVVPFSAGSLAATLAPDAVSDAEKAFEVFKYAIDVTKYFRADFCETLPTRHRPLIRNSLIKSLNIYPFDQCGPLNYTLRKMYLTAGISSNQRSGTHHSFQEAYHDGTLKLYDSSPRQYWLARDNKTVISRRELEDDPYLKLRQGGDVFYWLPGRKGETVFTVAERPHNMEFYIHPGERISICWHNEGRWFEMIYDRQPVYLPMIPPFFGNGAITYEPYDKGGSTELDNLIIEVSGDKRKIIQKDPSRSAALIYRAQCPYTISDCNVSGTYAADKAGTLRLSVSFDRGKSWEMAWKNPVNAGMIDLSLLDEVSARYEYWLKLDVEPGRESSVTGLQVRTTFCVAPSTLPETLTKGKNLIKPVGPPPEVPVRATCSWIERYRSELGISLNSISYYMNDDGMHRNLYVAAPEDEISVEVDLLEDATRLTGKGPEDIPVMIEGIPDGWKVKAGSPGQRPGSSCGPMVLPEGTAEGDIYFFEVVVRDGNGLRRAPVQLLVAEAPLVCEAEQADRVTGKVTPIRVNEASGATMMRFEGEGTLHFDFTADQAGEYALWLLARCDADSSDGLHMTIDGKTRDLRLTVTDGGHDWSGPMFAQSKRFRHYDEQHIYWKWYRIPGIRIGSGRHQLGLAAKGGMCFDALVLLPQTDVMDRAAMNLFQNYNYAPWRNPM